MRRRRRRKRRGRKGKFPICVKAWVIDPFGAAAQKVYWILYVLEQILI